jgi:glycosyltransferase involved in cell wall biosynthesis
MNKVLLISVLSTLKWGSRNAGGVDSVSQMLVQHLAKRESSDFYYRVLAFDPFCERPYTGEIIKLSPFVEVVVCPTNEKRFGLPVPGFVATALRVREQVDLFQPDIIHSHMLSCLIGISGRYRRILTLHSYKKIGRKPVSRANDFLYVTIFPWLSRWFVDQYTCVGEILKDALSQDVDKPIKVIGNPIDEAYFCAKKRSCRKRDVMKLVTCALVSRKKRIDRAISLVSELKKRGKIVWLRIIGPNSDQVYFEELSKQVQNLHVQEEVRFVGALDRDSIVQEYQRADIGVFFSEQETFGLAPLEMLAAGLPLLTTPVGILGEQINDFSSLGVRFVKFNDEIEQVGTTLLQLDKGVEKTIGYLKQNFSALNIIKSYESYYGIYMPE